MKRKIIGMMAGICMALCIFPTAAHAEETEERSDETVSATELQERVTVSFTDEERSADGNAYAVLTESGELIFFRSTHTYANKTSGTFADIKGNQYKGMIYAGFETFVNEDGMYRFDMVAPWNEEAHEITGVKVAEGQMISPLTMEGWFNGCGNLSSFSAEGLNTANVTDMSWMFNDCFYLQELDLSYFDTHNVKDMSYMFMDSGIRRINLSSFDTSNVETMFCMFYLCENLTELDLSSFDTSNTLDMGSMFAGCVELQKLDISSFDTSKVNSFDGTFKHCLLLEEIDVSHFDTSSCTNMFEMFLGCLSLKHLDVSGFDTSKADVTARMFYGCWQLEELDVSHFDTSNVTGMWEMFQGCSTLIELDVSGFDTDQVESIYGMFSECSGIRKLDLSGFDFSSAVYMENLFDGMDSLREVKLGKGFEIWTDNNCLTKGTWKHTGTGKTLSEKELYEQFPKNVSSMSGTWKRQNCVTGIEFDVNEVTIPFGDVYQLKVTLRPSNADNQKIMWNSEDYLIAGGKNGRIAANEKVGTTTITAQTYDGHFTAECIVHILFKDVTKKSQYYYDAVYWAAENDITTGTGPGEFSPSESCTREQFVTFLWRFMGEPEPKTESSFSDVRKNAWYYKPITWAYENGITTGLNDGSGRFGVGEACTREQCVTFLYRAAGSPSYKAAEPFTDVRQGKYYYDAINWAASSHITTGLNDGTGRFGVGQKCTRGMLVTFLYRYAMQSE